MTLDKPVRRFRQGGSMIQPSNPITQAAEVRLAVQGRFVEPVSGPGIALQIQGNASVREHDALDADQNVGGPGVYGLKLKAFRRLLQAIGALVSDEIQIVDTRTAKITIVACSSDKGVVSRSTRKIRRRR